MTHPTHDAVFRDAAEQWRAGRRADARHRVSVALTGFPDDAELLGFAGLLACQDDDPAAGAGYLRRSLALAPGDHAVRVNLMTALVACEALDEVAQVGARANQSDPRVGRMLAYVAQRQERHADAARLYGAVVAALPDDARSWNNLGNARAACGDVVAAMAAFESAVRLQPRDPAPRVNASKALTAAERHADRLSWMRRAAAAIPRDHAIQVELGLAEATERHFAAAEAAFRLAIELRPEEAEPYVELGLLLENLNRIDELGDLVEAAHRAGVKPDDIALVSAWLARRRGDWTTAAAHAARVGDTVIPLRRHHLRADIADRSGDPASAFAEFEAMNAAARALAPPIDGPSYREQVAAESEALARAGSTGVGTVAVARTPPAPVFIVGFPRSGTTLLDTLLMNDPHFHVMEELPVLPEVEAEARRDGGVLVADAGTLRRRYFEIAHQLSPAPLGTTIVDKFPLHLARLPLLHRLFPDAKVVLVERHPCDVVLSCFMANFQLNHAMRHFTTLAGTADLYDAVFSSFEQARALLPIDLHRVRYERLVTDLEGEMRALMAFVGVSWNPAVLDHQSAAARRDHIRTASYSQVTEPIYQRAAGRWERYRPFLTDVLPILAPWCERLGYDLPPG